MLFGEAMEPSRDEVTGEKATRGQALRALV